MARVHLGPLNRALVVESPDALLDELLVADGFSVTRHPGKAPNEDELIRLLQQTEAQVLFKRSRVPVTRKVLEAAPFLQAVQLCCIGDDSVDKRAAADHGVFVLNDPVSNGRSVVELAIGHLIALSRRLYETDAHTRAGGWDKSQTERYEIQGKVLGLLGLGNIGRAVARAAEALGMKIRFHDNREVAQEIGLEMGWESAPSVVELFRGSDCISLHPSARDANDLSNKGMISRELLFQLGADRPASSPRIFLNLARGFLHSTEDLLAAVQSGAIRRAAVDVYPEEPRGEEAWTNPYAAEPRIAVTPHIGASTLEAQPRIARRVAQTVRGFSRVGSLRDCVFGPRVRLGLVEDHVEGAVVLAVAHATTRGTKRAIDDAIYEFGASNLASAHKDFEALGVAYDLATLDKPLSAEAIVGLVASASRLTGDPSAIRSVRQIAL